ncbi:radical SAM protein [Chloroflexota bacterium]
MSERWGKDTAKQEDLIRPSLGLVAWEITRRCNLSCAHCRADAAETSYEGELTIEECFHLIDEILEVGRPIIILTGGEPLMREDILAVARYAVSRGLRVVMGSNGTLVTGDMAARLKEVPVSRLAISIDFPVAELQDGFRGESGAFEAALQGIANARRNGISVQINSTITRLNVSYMDELLALALKVGAVAFHPFLLVPTGRGKNLESVELSPQQYEDTLNWIYDRQMELGDRMFFKPTDAPHYLRIVSQRQARIPEQDRRATEKSIHNGHNPANRITRGCLAGTGFCFISYRGRVQGCGYLDVAAGNVREKPFQHIWFHSPLFQQLRNLANLKGKCGVCEYKRVCGGCRARAYEATGDYLEAEPYCIYTPQAWRETPEINKVENASG